MTDKEKIREEVKRLQNELIQEKEKGYGSDVDDACILELQNILTYIDSLQEEHVSEDLEEAIGQSFICHENRGDDFRSDEQIETAYRYGFVTVAKWQKNHLWKPADGDDLPEIDREVIALFDNDKVGYAHRPPEYWDGKNIDTGKVTRYYPKRYDGGGWNAPDVKWWLDLDIPQKTKQ